MSEDFAENITDVNNPYRYAGYEYLDEVELYDLKARYYDPDTARFLSADPYFDLGNRVMGLYEINVPNVSSIMQANALYAYCGNSPIGLIDSDGLSGILVDGSYHITHDLDRQLLELKQEYETASDERKIEIANEAKDIRNSGKEGIDWSVRADKPLDHYIIDVDITEKLDNIMKNAAEDNFWKRFGDILFATDVARHVDFANMVKPGGVYDLKSKPEWQGKEHFIYHNEILWYDDPGNIMYGYLGKAMGFSDVKLKAAAGIVQIYTGTSSRDYYSSWFDDPRDQMSIKLGIELFKQDYAWIWW